MAIEKEQIRKIIKKHINKMMIELEDYIEDENYQDIIDAKAEAERYDYFNER